MNYSSLRNTLSLYPLTVRRNLSDLSILYRIINSLIDSPFRLSKINFNIPHHSVRYPNIFYTKYLRTNYSKHSVNNRIQHTANDFSMTIDFSLSFATFKNIMSSNLLTYQIILPISSLYQIIFTLRLNPFKFNFCSIGSNLFPYEHIY